MRAGHEHNLELVLAGLAVGVINEAHRRPRITSRPFGLRTSRTGTGRHRYRSRGRCLRFRAGPVGAGNSAVVVDVPRCGPMLSPRVPNLVPIPGPRMEREIPGQRPRPNYGHPHPRPIARRIKTLTEETDQFEAAIGPLISAAAPSCSTSPASAPSPPPRSTSPGPTTGDAATRPRSPASARSRPSKPPPRRQHATAPTAAATATPTGRCTPSPSPAADTAPPPRPTSPKEPARARPHEKPGAASNATSPASSTDSYSTHQPPLDKHRSIGTAEGRWLPKGTDLIIGPVRLAIIEDHLNTMPRKLHDWHSAHSVYTELTCNHR